MNIEEKIYEIDDLWNQNNDEENDIYRIKYLAKLIPDDVKSLVDVGCGGGIFVNHLNSSNIFNRIVGIDRSSTALKYVNTEKIKADINSIPFSNGEFDIVTCLEVIEHIPYFNYNKALEELCRISNKYILISVPYNQNLLASLIKCPICFAEFNPDFHMRSYDHSKLHSLLDNYGFTCINSYNILKAPSFIGSNWLKNTLGIRKRVMPWYAICPVCGFHKDHHNSNDKELLPLNKNIIENFITKIWPKKDSYLWIAALYVKSSS